MSKSGDIISGSLKFSGAFQGIFPSDPSGWMVVGDSSYKIRNGYFTELHLDNIVTSDDTSVINKAYLKINSTNCIQVQFNLPSAVTFNPYGTANLLTTYDIKNSTATDQFSNKTLKTLFSEKTLKGIVGLFVSAVLIRDVIVWPDTEKISVSAYNPWSSSQTVNAVRLLVFYS